MYTIIIILVVHILNQMYDVAYIKGKCLFMHSICK